MDKATLEKYKEQLARKKEINKRTGSGGDFQFYKIPTDKCELRVRLLPSKGEEVFSFLTGKHWNLFGEEEVLPCLGIEQNADCPICDALQEVEGGSVDVSNQKPKGQTFVNALILSDSTGNAPNPKEPHILRLPQSLHFRLIECMLDPDIGDSIIDPENGVTVIFTREIKGRKVEVKTGIKTSPIADTPEEIKRILEKTVSLQKTFSAKVDDKLKSDLKKAADSIYQEASLAKTSLKSSAVEEANSRREIEENVKKAVEERASKTIEKPAGAPSCWGNNNTESDQCVACEYDIECEKVS